MRSAEPLGHARRDPGPATTASGRASASARTLIPGVALILAGLSAILGGSIAAGATLSTCAIPLLWAGWRAARTQIRWSRHGVAVAYGLLWQRRVAIPWRRIAKMRTEGGWLFGPRRGRGRLWVIERAVRWGGARTTRSHGPIGPLRGVRGLAHALEKRRAEATH